MRNVNFRLLIILIILLLGAKTLFAQNKPTITLGILIDGNENQFESVLKLLKTDAETILGSTYNIRMPADKILSANWSSDVAEKNYQRLVNDVQVDIVLGFGILNAAVIAKKGQYKKPVMIWGIFDPVLQGIALTTEGTSGVKNLTYLLQNNSLERDLDKLFQVYPYRKVGIAFTAEIFSIYNLAGEFLIPTMQRNNAEFKALPVANGINDVLNSLDDIDAVYVGYLGKFEGVEKTRLIEQLNSKGIATFGLTIDDAKTGALAAIGPETNLPAGVRRTILNIEAILDGQDAGSLPVNMTYEEDLTINMKTAQQINFSPSFKILSEATLINKFAVDTDRIINLLDVMYEAQQTNLDILIQEKVVQATEKDVSLARSDYFPFLTLSADGTVIDKELAEVSGGARQVSGTARLDQLIYSDQVIGNIGIQNQFLRAEQFRYEQVRLDVILTAASAYFKVLQAKSIRENRLTEQNLIKTNLEISRRREATGFSGRSDVYRWESRLASANTDLLSSEKDVERAKITLNQILNRQQNEKFIVSDASLSDTIFQIYIDNELSEYIKSPQSFDILTEFLIEEAIKNSPEIRQLDVNIDALSRRLGVFQRQRFIPTIGLGAAVERNFFRGGTGSNPEGVSLNKDSWSVGVNANLPIFQGTSVTVNIQQTKIDISQLEYQRSLLIQTVEQNVRTAVLEIIVQAVNLENSRKSADFAQRSLELVQDLYANGKVSIVDLIEAQDTALDTKLTELNAMYDYILATLTAERATADFRLLRTEEEETVFMQQFRTYLDSRLNN